MAEVGLAVAIVVAITAPHAAPLLRVAPMLAAAVWLNVLLRPGTLGRPRVG
jgi:hypothetical protein